MREIVLHISLLLLLLGVGCDNASDVTQQQCVSIAYLKSLCDDSSVRIKQDLYIEGCVVANDRYGDIDKAIVINDASGGIEVSIDCPKVEEIIKLYSDVRVNCSGLYIGREGARFVIGHEPTDRYVVDRIPEGEILNYVNMLRITGTPPQPTTMTVSEIEPSSVMRYVHVESLRVIDEEQGQIWCDTTTTLRNTLRHFTDGRDTLPVVVSRECDHATEVIPSEWCTLIGIIDWYDRRCALRIIAQQILIQ